MIFLVIFQNLKDNTALHRNPIRAGVFCLWFAEHDLRIIKAGEEKNLPKIKNPPKIKNLGTFFKYIIFIYFVHPRAAGSLIFERFRTLFVLQYILELFLTNY